jgi:hypothetical protein
MENEQYPKIHWWERKPNDSSAMRIALMITTITGATLILSAVVLGFFIFFTQRWEAINMVSIMLTSGGGILGIGELAKSIQAKGENQK